MSMYLIDIFSIISFQSLSLHSIIKFPVAVLGFIFLDTLPSFFNDTNNSFGKSASSVSLIHLYLNTSPVSVIYSVPT